MLKGGYKIVDFKDVDITTEAGGAVAGIFEEIEGSYRKALLVSGVTIDGVEQRDTFVNPTVNDGAYVFSVYGKTLTVKKDDTITVA